MFISRICIILRASLVVAPNGASCYFDSIGMIEWISYLSL